MSWLALAWAAKQKVTRATDKLVLIGLAERYNDEDELAWPSVAWLEEFSSLDRKTVIAAIGRLEQAGLIADSGKRRGKTGQVKAYALTFNTAAQTVPKTEQSQKRNSSDFPLKQSQKRDTEPFREPNVQKATPSSQAPRRSKPEKFVLPDWVPADAWEGFEEMRRKTRKPMTDRARALNLKRLEALAAEGHDPGEVLDQSVMNNWQGLFGIRERNDGHRQAAPTNRNGHAVRSSPSLDWIERNLGGAPDADEGASGLHRRIGLALPGRA